MNGLRSLTMKMMRKVTCWVMVCPKLVLGLVDPFLKQCGIHKMQVGMKQLKRCYFKKNGGKSFVAIEELAKFDHKDENNKNEPIIGTQDSGMVNSSQGIDEDGMDYCRD